MMWKLEQHFSLRCTLPDKRPTAVDKLSYLPEERRGGWRDGARAGGRKDGKKTLLVGVWVEKERLVRAG